MSMLTVSVLCASGVSASVSRIHLAASPIVLPPLDIPLLWLFDFLAGVLLASSLFGSSDFVPAFPFFDQADLCLRSRAESPHDCGHALSLGTHGLPFASRDGAPGRATGAKWLRAALATSPNGGGCP